MKDTNNEITVTINSDYNSLIKKLEKKGFKHTGNYIISDIYLIKNETNFNKNTLDILSECVIARNNSDKILSLLHKCKEYDENENIISQSKTQVLVKDINSALDFMKAIGYKELIEIHNNTSIYEKNGLELAIQQVNDKYLFIEIEENDKYKGINSLIKELENIGIEYYKDDYFVKKAKIIFEEKYKNN